MYGAYNLAQAGYYYVYEEISGVGSPASQTHVNSTQGSGYGGGLLLGFWVRNTNFAYGVNLDFLVNNSAGGAVVEPNDALGIAPENSTLTTNIALRNETQLAFAFLMQLTQHFATFVKAGVGFVSLRYRFDNNNVRSSHTDFGIKESYTYPGWVFGVGIQTAFSNRWALFAEYTRGSYGSHNLDTKYHNVNGAGIQLDRRLQNIISSTVKLAFTYVFSTG